MNSNPETLAIHWPNGVEIELVKEGILLRPKKKAREGWAESIDKNPMSDKEPDEFADWRSFGSDFDEKEWEW